MRDGNIELSFYLTKTESFQGITVKSVMRNLNQPYPRENAVFGKGSRRQEKRHLTKINCLRKTPQEEKMLAQKTIFTTKSKNRFSSRAKKSGLGNFYQSTTLFTE
jgi:hypothetical protein